MLSNICLNGLGEGTITRRTRISHSTVTANGHQVPGTMEVTVITNYWPHTRECCPSRTPDHSQKERQNLFCDGHHNEWWDQVRPRELQPQTNYIRNNRGIYLSFQSWSRKYVRWAWNKDHRKGLEVTPKELWGQVRGFLSTREYPLQEYLQGGEGV